MIIWNFKGASIRGILSVAFDVPAELLGREATFLAGPGRAGGVPFLLRGEGLSYQGFQAPMGGLQVAALLSVLVTDHLKVSLSVEAGGEFLPEKLYPILAHDLRCGFQVEAKIDLGGDLVDILSAGSSGTRVAHREQAARQGSSGRNE
jgi:hypothetical protein